MEHAPLPPVPPTGPEALDAEAWRRMEAAFHAASSDPDAAVGRYASDATSMDVMGADSDASVGHEATFTRGDIDHGLVSDDPDYDRWYGRSRDNRGTIISDGHPYSDDVLASRGRNFDPDATIEDFGRSLYSDSDRDHEGTKIISDNEREVGLLTGRADRILTRPGQNDDGTDKDLGEDGHFGRELFRKVRLEEGDEIEDEYYPSPNVRATVVRKDDGTVQTKETRVSSDFSLEDLGLGEGDVVEAVAYSPEDRERLVRVRTESGTVYYRRDNYWYGNRVDANGHSIGSTRGSFITMWREGGDEVVATKVSRYEGPDGTGGYAQPKFFAYEGADFERVDDTEGVHVSLERAFPEPEVEEEPSDEEADKEPRVTHTRRLLGRLGVVATDPVGRLPEEGGGSLDRKWLKKRKEEV